MNGKKMGADYPETTGGDNLRSGLVLYPAHYQTIDQILQELVQKIPARFVLLTDVTGQVVSAHGDQSQIDLVALGSLIAGDLAASQEIARLTGQYQSYQLILREGLLSHTFITEAGQQFVLFVQTPGDTPLGWARMLIRRGAERLAEFTAELATESAPIELDLEENLSTEFDHALDNIWLE